VLGGIALTTFHPEASVPAGISEALEDPRAHGMCTTTQKDEVSADLLAFLQR
jgi:hypothetical protein